MKAIKKEVNKPCEVIDIDCKYVCDVIKAVPELGYILDEEIYDYEVDGLSNEDVELIKKIFTEDNQAKLSKKFDEIYKDRDYWSPIVTTW